MVSMLEESHVQIHVHADDWEDAIERPEMFLLLLEVLILPTLST